MLDNLELIGTGFAVVMAVLASLWGACSLIGTIFAQVEKSRAEAAAKAAPVPASAPPSAPTTSGGIPAHHLVAIAAAVASVLGDAYRITRVAAPAHQISDWPLEGRIENFTAHRIRTNWGPTRPTLGGETPDILRGQK
ncbi:MAG: OadG family protein [Rhodospirillum sp.]|nr:OadG family protein [Rhodospirillum sp.]MCF8489873.1 OadG family protein [Rhodospirillum sp.]MCF8499436.1 OadG family protein [Rhodospirillum sp.]